MKHLTFNFDTSLCSACFACVVACQDQNDFINSDTSFRQVVTHEAGVFPGAKINSLSIACFHCGDAPCLMVCPTGAIFRQDETGIVDLNRDLCIGCHSCALACPFGAPRFLEDGKMAKCHLCSVRIEHDMDPACVRVCSTGALTFGPSQEISETKAIKSSVTIIESLIKG